MMPQPTDPDSAAASYSFLAPPELLADWRLVLAYDAAAGAGVLDALPGTLAELAGRCGLDERGLRPVLGLLVAGEIVTADAQGRYAVAGTAPGWPADAMLRRHADVIRRWSQLLPERLRDRTAGVGQQPPADRPAGTFIETGLHTLAAVQRPLARPLLDLCLQHFPHAVRMLDLGGGHGEHSLEAARRGLRPTMQDLPAVVDAAERRAGLSAAGVDLFAGDLHTSLPPGPFDLVLLSTVTNMFAPDRNRDLYQRLRAVLAPGGGLAIATYLRGHHPVAASFGVQMLVGTDSGDAHGADDYRRWLSAAGFDQIEVRDLADSAQAVVLARQPRARHR